MRLRCLGLCGCRYRLSVRIRSLTRQLCLSTQVNCHSWYCRILDTVSNSDRFNATTEEWLKLCASLRTEIHLSQGSSLLLVNFQAEREIHNAVVLIHATQVSVILRQLHASRRAYLVCMSSLVCCCCGRRCYRRWPGLAVGYKLFFGFFPLLLVFCCF